MPQDEEQKTIGRVSATEKDPSTSETFSFWLSDDVSVNPFDIVEGDHTDGSKTYGLVTALEHITDSFSHLSNYISNNFGEFTEEPNTPRQGATIAKAKVMKNTSKTYMPLRSESKVKYPDAKGIETALGIDEMAEEDRIVAGQIELSNKTNSKAYIDKRFTLGPEAAHINISGISGLATKTSYAMFLIQSMMQKLPENEVAVVILNVKHGDLLHIDEVNEKLTPEAKKKWTDLGLECEPFKNVKYYLPRNKDGYGPNSQNPPDASKYKTYAYELKDAVDKLGLLFSNIPDANQTLDSMVGELTDKLLSPNQEWSQVSDWNALINNSPFVSNGAAKKFGDIAAASVGRFRRQLRRIVQTRQSGVFVPRRSQFEISLSSELGKELTGGNTFVVDIALLKDEEQTLVFGDVLKTIYGLFFEPDDNRQTPLPKKVLIFVDELNKFAPDRGDTSPIIEQILDIAERGRSLGLILVSAQQFLSAVHPRVTGNSATKVYGRTGSTEVYTAHYRSMDEEQRAALTRLDKGELILQHPVFRQPIKVTFPLACYKQP